MQWAHPRDPARGLCCMEAGGRAGASVVWVHCCCGRTLGLALLTALVACRQLSPAAMAQGTWATVAAAASALPPTRPPPSPPHLSLLFSTLTPAHPPPHPAHLSRKDAQEGYKTVVEQQPVFIHPSSALFQHQPQVRLGCGCVRWGGRVWMCSVGWGLPPALAPPPPGPRASVCLRLVSPSPLLSAAAP